MACYVKLRYVTWIGHVFKKYVTLRAQCESALTGHRRNACLMSILAMAAEGPRRCKMATALSTVLYFDVKSSLEIWSLTLDPNGADKCIMSRHAPPFGDHS